MRCLDNVLCMQKRCDKGRIEKKTGRKCRSERVGIGNKRPNLSPVIEVMH